MSARPRRWSLIHPLLSVAVMCTVSLVMSHAAWAAASVCRSGTLFGRAQCVSYFSGKNDEPNIQNAVNDGEYAGDHVLENGGAGLTDVHDAAEFEQLIYDDLYGKSDSMGADGSYDDEIGAAFVISIMMGDNGTSFSSATNGISTAKSNYTDWKSRVDDYTNGLTKGSSIDWDETVTYTAPFVNTMLEIVNKPVDDVFYTDTTSLTQTSIVFNNPNGTHFELKKDCGNPAGEMSPISPQPTTSPPSGHYAASTTVNPNQIAVDETAIFDNYITVTQYSSPASVGWSVQRTVNGGNSGSPTTGTLQTSKNGTFDVDQNSYTATAAPGSTVCETLTIANPPPDDQVSPRSSTSCLTILAQPYLTVSGGDVWTGSNFDYRDDNCQGDPGQASSIKTYDSPGGYGSVAQFAVFALGSITGLGSAGNPSGTGLTYANTPLTGSYGPASTFTRCIGDYYSAVGHSGNDPGATFSASSLANVTNASSGLYYHNGSVTITGGQVGGGVHAAVVVNGTVTITGDITYPGSYTSLSDIPSLWIISNGDINVQDSVGTITGLYVAEGQANGAGGVIQTCVDPNAPEDDTTTYNPLTTTVCNIQLTVDGALLARQVYWQRTDGSDSPGQPAAEQIEFSPELYLQSPLMGITPADGLQTTDITQLPPIF